MEQVISGFDRSVENMVIKKMLLLLLLVTVCICLSACGRRSVRRKNPDGTVTRIEYKSAATLQRAPYFEIADTSLCMSFNGTVWYEASIIDADTEKWVSDGKLICESSNIRVYEANRHAGYEYAYVLALNGTKDSFILFYSDAEPHTGTYGNDFTTSVHYYVDKEETVPDLTFD